VAVPTLTALASTEFARVDQPVALASRPGDDGLFVVERPGRVVRLDDGGDGRVVLDVTEVVSSDYYEDGLLGLAFDPSGSFAYVYYVSADADTVLAEYSVDPVDGRFDAASAREILVIGQPGPGHNGGQLAFGPDGRLYVGVGDGENPGDPGRWAQRASSKLGKILRIDPRPTDGSAFEAPSDNPFVDTPGADPTIWASGLRNPWRFSFDSATGDLWIADVGQDTLEEINHVRASGGVAGRGANFGWSAFEGDIVFNVDQHDRRPRPPAPHVGSRVRRVCGRRWRGRAERRSGRSRRCVLLRRLVHRGDLGLGRGVAGVSAGRPTCHGASAHGAPCRGWRRALRSVERGGRVPTRPDLDAPGGGSGRPA
jgi:glucose/arabinose dehydrogenase